MANKTYTVMKDGETIRELKSLAAARKLADTEEAEVFCEGVCVYAHDPAVGDSGADGPASISDSDPFEDEPAGQAETVTPEKYVLTARMNIRKAPSLDAPKLGTAKKGTVVEVSSVEDGWMRLLDGTFILYEGGRWAEKHS